MLINWYEVKKHKSFHRLDQQHTGRVYRIRIKLKRRDKFDLPRLSLQCSFMGNLCTYALPHRWLKPHSITNTSTLRSWLVFYRACVSLCILVWYRGTPVWLITLESSPFTVMSIRITNTKYWNKICFQEIITLITHQHEIRRQSQ